MKYILLSLFCVLSAITCFAQSPIISGSIVDAVISDPIPYVNIGVLGKGIGTVSNPDGSFELDLKETLDSDSIRFSYLGYKSISFSIESLKATLLSDSIITMEEDTQLLKEVVIVGRKKFKKKVIGSDAQSTAFGFSYDLGGAIGRRFNIRKESTQLLNFEAFVKENTYESIKLRLNIYYTDNKIPGERINRENIYIDFSDPSGPIKVDLEKYKIFVDQDVIVTLEWVDFVGDGYFSLGSKFGTSGIKVRYASEGEWATYPMTLGFNMLVAY